MGKELNRPKYIVEVNRDWRNKRYRYWTIKEWVSNDGYDGYESGFWSRVTGGLSFSDAGMWRAVNKKLKKLQYGHTTNYFTVDKKPIDMDKYI